MKVKSLSRVRPSGIPWTAAYQAPPSMGFSRQEYWSGVPFDCQPPNVANLELEVCLPCAAKYLGEHVGGNPKGNHSFRVAFVGQERKRDRDRKEREVTRARD